MAKLTKKQIKRMTTTDHEHVKIDRNNNFVVKCQDDDRYYILTYAGKGIITGKEKFKQASLKTICGNIDSFDQVNYTNLAKAKKQLRLQVHDFIFVPEGNFDKGYDFDNVTTYRYQEKCPDKLVFEMGQDGMYYHNGMKFSYARMLDDKTAVVKVCENELYGSLKFDEMKKAIENGAIYNIDQLKIFPLEEKLVLDKIEPSLFANSYCYKQDWGTEVHNYITDDTFVLVEAYENSALCTNSEGKHLIRYEDNVHVVSDLHNVMPIGADLVVVAKGRTHYLKNGKCISFSRDKVCMDILTHEKFNILRYTDATCDITNKFGGKNVVEVGSIYKLRKDENLTKHVEDLIEQKKIFERFSDSEGVYDACDVQNCEFYGREAKKLEALIKKYSSYSVLEYYKDGKSETKYINNLAKTYDYLEREDLGLLFCPHVEIRFYPDQGCDMYLVDAQENSLKKLNLDEETIKSYCEKLNLFHNKGEVNMFDLKDEKFLETLKHSERIWVKEQMKRGLPLEQIEKQVGRFNEKLETARSDLKEYERTHTPEYIAEQEAKKLAEEEEKKVEREQKYNELINKINKL